MHYMEVIPSLISLYLGPISGKQSSELNLFSSRHNRCREEARDVYPVPGSRNLRQPDDRQCLHGGLGSEIPVSRTGIHSFWGIHAFEYCNVSWILRGVFFVFQFPFSVGTDT